MNSFLIKRPISSSTSSSSSNDIECKSEDKKKKTLNFVPREAQSLLLSAKIPFTTSNKRNLSPTSSSCTVATTMTTTTTTTTTTTASSSYLLNPFARTTKTASRPNDETIKSSNQMKFSAPLKNASCTFHSNNTKNQSIIAHTPSSRPSVTMKAEKMSKSTKISSFFSTKKQKSIDVLNEIKDPPFLSSNKLPATSDASFVSRLNSENIPKCLKESDVECRQNDGNVPTHIEESGDELKPNDENMPLYVKESDHRQLDLMDVSNDATSPTQQSGVDDLVSVHVSSTKDMPEPQVILISNMNASNFSSTVASAKSTQTAETAGVIRNQISPFSLDSKGFSQTAKYLLGMTKSRLHSLVASSMQTVAGPDSSVRLSSVPADATSAVATREGVTCIKFDKCGVLCAVGGSNGVLRVYDFDDVAFGIQKSRKVRQCDIEACEGTPTPIYPIIHYPVSSRGISDICWLSGTGSEDDEDHVVISFSSHPVVKIVDLNTIDNVMSLKPSLGSVSGNRCVANWTNSHCRQQNLHKVLSGAANGMFRCWNFKLNSGSDEDFPAWEVLSDPLSKPGSHCAVSSILPSSFFPDIITTVTTSGVIVQWDTSKLSVQSFSSKAKPSALHRAAIGTSISSSMPSVLSASFCSKACALGSQRGSSRRSHPSETCVLLTFNNAQATVFDILEKKVLEEIDLKRVDQAAPHAPLTTSPDDNVVLESQPRIYCGMKLFPFTGSQLVYSASPFSNVLCVLRLGGTTSPRGDLPYDHIRRHHLKVLQDQQLHFANAESYSLALKNYDNSRLDKYLTQQIATICLSAKPMMQRCSRVCHTLEGFVAEATCGSVTIETSVDLTHYLCGTGFECKDVSSSGSSSIHGMLNGNKSSVVHFVQNAPTEDPQTYCHSIKTIIGCTITLDRPYQGPKVRTGRPRVRIRTNLSLRVPPELCESIIKSRSIDSSLNTAEEPSGLCGELLRRIQLPSKATAIQSSPSSAFVVVGCRNDEVVVLSPGC